MNLDDMQEAIRDVSSESRYTHTIRVVDTAKALAKRYGVSIEKVTLAALLHDYAKCFSVEVLQELLNKYHLAEELIQYHHELWHGPVGAELVREKYSINDVDILNAIRYHTTGRPAMTPIEYIIFVADYIEPERNFTGVEEVRKLAMVNLEEAARKALQNTIVYLLKQDATIHPDSFLAYNALTETKKER